MILLGHLEVVNGTDVYCECEVEVVQCEEC